jgi:hypothetical protein
MKKESKIDQEIKINGTVLQCPGCGNEYLHHGRVAVYQRAVEDDPVTAMAIVDLGHVSQNLVQSHTSGNPSSRRSGIAIAFSCEECNLGAELCISQHKGQTLIEWRKR